MSRCPGVARERQITSLRSQQANVPLESALVHNNTELYSERASVVSSFIYLYFCDVQYITIVLFDMPDAAPPGVYTVSQHLQRVFILSEKTCLISGIVVILLTQLLLRATVL